jgi:hypothetical protein
METAGPEELLIKVIPILETLKIEYCITGGLAVSVWGRPRATFDIDIVIKMVEPQVNSLAKALRKISEAGYIDENAAKEAIQHKGEFNFIDSESGLKVDFWVAKKDKLSLLELKRKRLKKIGGQNIYFISPEDLILSKLQWYQESESTRHLEDIESVLKISGKILDKQYLKKWAGKLKVLKILNKLNSL